MTPEDNEYLRLHPDYALHRKTFLFVSDTVGKTPGPNHYAPLQAETFASILPAISPLVFERHRRR